MCNTVVVIVIVLCIFCIHGYVVIESSVPSVSDRVVTFSIQVEQVDTVFVAGSWNQFAHNRNGYVDNPKYQCENVGNSTFQYHLLLPSGEYKFKFVFDNSDWYSIPELPHDDDQNAVFWINNQLISKEETVIVDPHWSFSDIPFSNGFSAAKFNVPEKYIDNWSNHIYKQVSPQEMTINMIKFVDVLLTYQNGTTRFLSSLSINSLDDIGYLDRSGIVNVRYQDDKSIINAYFYSSFLVKSNNLRISLNLESTQFTDAKLFISWNPNIHVVEKGENYYQSDIGSFTVSKNVENLWYSFSLDHLRQSEPNLVSSSMLEEEISFWKTWRISTKYPSNMTEAEKILYDQSLVILKMAQCLESGRSNGQILASLPPGMWNICWVRDGSYATLGLILSGHYDEAKLSLEFFLNADVGNYVHFYVDGIDYGVGVPYQISVCRYFGDGSEDSDGGSDPNIELDGFGLFLWAFETYVSQTNDIKFLETHWEIVKTKIADVLVHVIDKRFNITQRDSSIWERHIVPDGKDNGAKHFTYSTITSIKGLRSASILAKKMNLYSLHIEYENASNSLEKGLLLFQVDHKNNVLKDSLETQLYSEYVDASVVEAINFDVVPPHDIITNSTLEAFEEHLHMPFRAEGYRRTQGNDLYDKREWIVMDLRIASAYHKIGNSQKSQNILNWVVMQSHLNYNIMAELYTIKSANYEGAIPMCGFGPGALVLHSWHQ